MHIPELSPQAYEPSMHTGAEVRAVGWLGVDVPREGQIAPDLLAALRYYSKTCYHSDGYRGVHTCEVCKRGKRANSHGEFWIECRGLRYVLPMMVFHYIEVHRYLPPDEFLAALEQKWLEGSRSRCGVADRGKMIKYGKRWQCSTGSNESGRI